jgi:glc operon protein GlcG
MSSQFASSSSYGLPVTLEAAKKAAAAALAVARKNNWTMAVAIVDPGGYLVYFEKMEDTQLAGSEIAIEKARSAALFKRPTKVMQDMLDSGGSGLRVFRLHGAIPVEGGLPLISDGKIVGAIGLSGSSSENDGLCAQAGVDTLK